MNDLLRRNEVHVLFPFQAIHFPLFLAPPPPPPPPPPTLGVRISLSLQACSVLPPFQFPAPFSLCVPLFLYKRIVKCCGLSPLPLPKGCSSFCPPLQQHSSLCKPAILNFHAESSLSQLILSFIKGSVKTSYCIFQYFSKITMSSSLFETASTFPQ